MPVTALGGPLLDQETANSCFMSQKNVFLDSRAANSIRGFRCACSRARSITPVNEAIPTYNGRYRGPVSTNGHVAAAYRHGIPEDLFSSGWYSRNPTGNPNARLAQGRDGSGPADARHGAVSACEMRMILTKNLEGGARYLSETVSRIRIMASWRWRPINAGPEAVRKHKWRGRPTRKTQKLRARDPGSIKNPSRFTAGFSLWVYPPCQFDLRGDGESADDCTDWAQPPGPVPENGSRCTADGNRGFFAAALSTAAARALQSGRF